MLESSVQITTTDPSRLIRRLCKHWSHKFEVTHDDRHGSIPFGSGHCELRADEGRLTALVRAEDAAQLEKLETVVADHLQRMAADETFSFDWKRRA